VRRACAASGLVLAWWRWATGHSQLPEGCDRHTVAYLRMGGKLAAEGPGCLGTGSRLFGGRRRNGSDSWGDSRRMKVEGRAG
jgi:hypothetical protein